MLPSFRAVSSSLVLQIFRYPPWPAWWARQETWQQPWNAVGGSHTQSKQVVWQDVALPCIAEAISSGRHVLQIFQISSTMGSAGNLAANLYGGGRYEYAAQVQLPYRASKAALNMGRPISSQRCLKSNHPQGIKVLRVTSNFSQEMLQ